MRKNAYAALDCVKFEPSDRKKLYERINARVDEMFAAGLVDEIAALRPSREWQSMQGDRL